MKEEFVIFVDRGDLKSSNYNTNFTIAEEFAHYILHKECYKLVKNFNDAISYYSDFISDESKMVVEYNAMYLAGAILLPKEHVRNLSIKTFEKHKSTFSHALKDGNLANFDEIIDIIAKALTHTYRVHVSAISYRLKSQAVGFNEYIKENIKK